MCAVGAGLVLVHGRTAAGSPGNCTRSRNTGGTPATVESGIRAAGQYDPVGAADRAGQNLGLGGAWAVVTGRTRYTQARQIAVPAPAAVFRRDHLCWHG